MSRRIPLWCSDDLNVHRFDHPPGDHAHGPVDEVGRGFSASFVEHGGFVVETEAGRWRLAAGDLLLVHPGMRFRVSHPDGDLRDVCLSVGYTSAAEGHELETHEPADIAPARAWRPAQAPMIAANNRLRYLYWGLRRGLGGGAPLLAETCAGDLLRAISGVAERAPVARAYKARTLDRYAQRVHAARERIDRDYAHDLRLDAIAREAGMSAFHFARVFAELVGAPPHRYLRDARLRAAAAMLRDGRNVTDTCFACGFNDLSHFGRAFAQRYGRTPSVYLRRPA
jgi:AraC family transcriptional regulator